MSANLLQAENAAANILDSGRLDLDTVIALVAMFLGLAVGVQVLQEIYKFFTTSKARTYRKALRRFLGKWVDEHYGTESMSSLLVRGPFYFLRGITPASWKEKTPAHLLPLDQEELILALERTAPPWVREALDALRREAELQGGTPAKPTRRMAILAEDLWKEYGNDTCAQRVFDFLERWQVVTKPKAGAPAPQKPKVSPDTVDAASTLGALSQSFLPKRETVIRDYGQFTRNFEHAYLRRNLRQTLFLSLILTVGLGLPFDGLYRRAAALSPEELETLVTSVNRIYEEDVAGKPKDGAVTPKKDPTKKKGGDEPSPDPDNTKPNDKETKVIPETTGVPPEPGEPRVEAPADPEGTVPDGQPSGGTAVQAENVPGGANVPKPAKTDPEVELEDLAEQLKKAVAATLPATETESLFLRGWKQIAAIWDDSDEETQDRPPQPEEQAAEEEGSRALALADHLANCLITALFIAFGAPFWHRILEALLRLRGPAAVGSPAPKGAGA